MRGEQEPCDTCDATGDDGCGNDCAACEGRGWVRFVRPSVDDGGGEVLVLTESEYRRQLREEKRQVK